MIFKDFISLADIPACVSCGLKTKMCGVRKKVEGVWSTVWTCGDCD